MQKMQQAQNLSGAILFFFICLFAYTKLVGPIPFAVTSLQTTKDNFFTASGTGEVKATPDTAMLSLGVMVHASTSDDAKSQMNDVTNKVVADLKTLGIEEKDIKTTNVSVYEDTNNNPQPLTRPAPISTDKMVAPLVIPQLPSNKVFTGNETIEVHAKSIELANKAIDIATKDGANMISAPTMVVNDNKRKDLMKQARKKAIDDAKANAAELASEAGIKLGKIVDIQDNSGGNVRYAAFGKAADVNVESAPTQLNPGEDTISVSVTLSYETL